MGQQVDVRGVALDVDDAGGGRPFLWGHGLRSSRASEAERGLFDWSGIGPGVRRISYDARGHGESGFTDDPGHYRWPELARDMLALADALGLDRFAAGGASMGCATTLHAAVQAPERIEAMVLVIPPTAWATRAARAGLYREQADAVERGGLAAYLDLAAKAPIPGIFAPEPSLARRLPAVAEAHLATVMRGAADSDLPPADQLAQLGQPALVLAWDTDPAHPRSTAEELARVLPAAELEVATELAEVRAWPARVGAFLSSLPS